MAIKRKAEPEELRREDITDDDEEEMNEEDDEVEEDGEEENAEDAEVEEDVDEESMRRLLEPFSKDQLRDILRDAVLKDKTLLKVIRQAAEKDTSHRKIFVRGLGWEVKVETLKPVFEKYGDIEDCTVVIDKASGKCKGYGFVTFYSMEAAMKCLEEPNKQIGTRTAACQLASIGPTVPQGTKEGGPNRKIYVGNVPPEVSSEKLYKFFSKFGDIEEGPLGMDKATGKFRGYALFIYKTAEGAQKALEVPQKNIDGHSMPCKWASSGQNKKPQGPVTVSGPLDPNDLALTRGAGSLLGAQFNPLLSAQAFNPGLLGGMNPAYGAPGFGGGAPGVNPFGMYGSQPLQSLNPYQGGQQQSMPGRGGHQPGSGGVNPYLSR